VLKAFLVRLRWIRRYIQCYFYFAQEDAGLVVAIHKCH
jgi:hypothetical protein